MSNEQVEKVARALAVAAALSGCTPHGHDQAKDILAGLGIEVTSWPVWPDPCPHTQWMFTMKDGRDGVICGNGAVFVRWLPPPPDSKGGK